MIILQRFKRSSINQRRIIGWAVTIVVPLMLYSMYQICWIIQFNEAQKGFVYFQQQNYAEALPHLRQLYRLKPDLPGIRTMIARSLYEEKENAASVSEYGTIKNRNDWSAVDYYTYGNALWAEGNDAEARIQWIKAFNLANVKSRDQDWSRSGYNKHIANLAYMALKLRRL